MFLSNPLFLEEERRSLSTPTSVEESECGPNFKNNNKSTNPNITLDTGKSITCVADIWADRLVPSMISAKRFFRYC